MELPFVKDHVLMSLHCPAFLDKLNCNACQIMTGKPCNSPFLYSKLV